MSPQLHAAPPHVLAMLAALQATAPPPTTREKEHTLAGLKSAANLPAADQPIGTCPVCLCELDIPSIASSSATADRSPAAVLLCGHVICRPCRDQHLQAAYDRHVDSECPLCRLELHAKRCAHRLVADDIPAHDEDKTLNDLPATLAEGGEVPNHCRHCDAWLRTKWETEIQEERDERDEWRKEMWARAPLEEDDDARKDELRPEVNAGKTPILSWW